MGINGHYFRGQQAAHQMQQLSGEIDRARTQIATGQRRLRPSDDPVGYARSVRLSRHEGSHAVWQSNLAQLAAHSARADTVMASMADAMQRAGELMVRGANATASDSDRAAIALELESIAETVTELSLGRNPDGSAIFEDAPLEVPVGADARIKATVARGHLVGAVAAANGQTSIAAIIGDGVAALRTTNAAARAPLVRVALDAVSSAQRHVGEMRTTQGIIGARIDAWADRIEGDKQIVSEEKAKVDGVDVGEAVTRAGSHQLALQATQSLWARIMSRSLFDLLG
ncbi:MAG: flagellin [Sphingopyxis sp.]